MVQAFISTNVDSSSTFFGQISDICIQENAFENVINKTTAEWIVDMW